MPEKLMAGNACVMAAILASEMGRIAGPPRPPLDTNPSTLISNSSVSGSITGMEGKVFDDTMASAPPRMHAPASITMSDVLGVSLVHTGIRATSFTASVTTEQSVCQARSSLSLPEPAMIDAMSTFVGCAALMRRRRGSHQSSVLSEMSSQFHDEWSAAPSRFFIETRASSGAVRMNFAFAPYTFTTGCSPMVLVTTPPQPASKARMMLLSDSVGGADERRKGFSNVMPVKFTERFAMEISSGLPVHSGPWSHYQPARRTVASGWEIHNRAGEVWRGSERRATALGAVVGQPNHELRAPPLPAMLHCDPAREAAQLKLVRPTQTQGCRCGHRSRCRVAGAVSRPDP